MGDRDDSSSSDFSSDEELDALSTASAYGSSQAAPTVAVLDLDDALEVEISADDAADDAAADLLATLRADGATSELLHVLEPVLTAQTLAYEAFMSALAALGTEGATQRRARREVFRRFQRAFPLTPELYSEYAASVGALARLPLYEQAQRDYWSAPLAVEHLQLLSECCAEQVRGVSWRSVETALERALATVGHHYTQGHDVWTTARELTAQHLDDAAEREKEAALRALFVRQMRLPLQQNDLAMSEFRAWNAYNTLEDARERERAIREAERFQQQGFGGAVYKKLNQFEARLTAALGGLPSPTSDEVEAPEKVWMQYLRYAQFRLAPVMASPDDAERYVVCLMERAVASVCLSSNLWSQYVAYVKSHRPDELLQVSQRATRNVSFDSAFWVEWLLAMEAAGKSEESIVDATRTALLERTSPPLMDAAHMTRAVTTLCGVVRRISKDSEVSVDNVVALCQGFLETVFPNYATPIAALLSFQAHFYAFRVQSGEAEKTPTWLALWQEIVRIRGAQAEAWLSFYDEYRFVHAGSKTLVQDLRELVFKPAAEQVQDYLLSVLDRWVTFEQSVGDQDAFVVARDRYQALALKQQYQAVAHAVVETAPAVSAPAPSEKATNKKRKADSTQPGPTKRQKQAETEVEIKKTERFSNENTLFVRNLSKDVTKDELQALFGHIATLQDVRLVVKERGNHVKSRGMAYVQFSDDSGVVSGLGLDGTVLHGQAIKVERSIPPSGKSVDNAKTTRDNKGSKTNTTLYVGGLQPPDREAISEDQIKTALTELLGEESVKQVLILTDRKGRPKDYGLVQVVNANLVDAAIKKQAELKLKLGDQITVQTSRMTIDQVVRHRDEQKQATQNAKETKQKPPPQDKRKKEAFQAKVAPHAKPNTRLAMPGKPLASAASLMPRALRKKTVAATAASTSETPASAPEKTEATTSTAPKTNADFRKLFLS